MSASLTKQIASMGGLACAGTALIGAVTGSIPVLAVAASLGAAATAANMASSDVGKSGEGKGASSKEVPSSAGR